MSFKDIFRARDGEVVIAQRPNPPLIIAFIFFLLRFVPIQYLDTISQWGTNVFLLYWSFLEIVSGVNLFRRLLGLTVMIYLLLKIISKII